MGEEVGALKERGRASLADQLTAAGDGTLRRVDERVDLRGIPQLLGSGQDALDFVRRQLTVELNSASWNPLVVASERRLISVSSLEVAPLGRRATAVRLWTARFAELHEQHASVHGPGNAVVETVRHAGYTLPHRAALA